MPAFGTFAVARNRAPISRNLDVSTSNIAKGLYEVWATGTQWEGPRKHIQLITPSSAINIATKKGRMTQLDGASSINGDISGIAAGSNRTLLVVCKLNASREPYDVLASLDNNSAETYLRIQVSPSTNGFGVFDNVNFYTSSDVYYDSIVDTIAVFIAVFNEGQLSLYLNGKEIAGGGSSGGSITPTKICIGGYAGQDGAWLYGAIGLTAIWNRGLTLKEVKVLSLNPWQIYAPESQFVYIPGPVAAIYRRALIQSNGRLKQISDGQLGTQPVIVWHNNKIKVRQSTEGTPLVIVDGRLQLLKASETLIS